MRFVETPVFTALVTRHLPDEEYRAVQLALRLRPEQGALIPAVAGFVSFGGALRDAASEEAGA